MCKIISSYLKLLITAYNFQIGSKKIKLLTEYENATEKNFITYRLNIAEY
jgi:uncharacterized Zn finger protein